MTDLQLAEGNYLKPNATGGYRISYSQLSAWSRCQLQKHYQDVAKADPEAPQPEWLSAMVYGSVIHTALHVLEQLHHEGRDDALEVAQRTFAYYWEPANLHELGLKITAWVPRTTWGGLNDRGKLALAEYYDLRLKKDKSKLLGLEYEFAVPIEVRGVQHTMYGFIDRLTIDRSNSKPYISCDDFKGLAIDMPIPTPDGWAAMGDLRVGDEVFGADGHPTVVTAKSEVHDRPCYRVTFDDLSEVICDNVHRWTVLAGQPAALRSLTADIETLKAMHDEGTPLRVPNARPLRLDDRELPVDPYLFGLWLGDGSTRGGELTLGDAEIWGDLKRQGYEFGPNTNGRATTCETRNVRGLTAGLRKIGVLGDKNIPTRYLRGSWHQRLDLLRGLLDSDGSWNKTRRQVVFTNNSGDLLDGVLELACSMGWKARRHPMDGYRHGVVTFTPTDLNPFRMARKANAVTTLLEGRDARARRRRITLIESVDPVPTQCIAVDAPDELYLCGQQMVPTHNSGKQQTYLRYNQQGSAYCLDPETLIAVSDGGWRPIGELEAGDKVLAVDEELVTTDGGKRSRRWREADVERVWRTRKVAYRLVFSDGQSLTASADHRFLAHREGHWSWRTVADIAAQLANPRRKTPGIKVARALRPPVTFKIDYEGQDYCAGYLAGAQLGDGYMRGDVDAFPYWAIGVGEDDRALVDRVRTCASGFGVKLHQSIRLPDGRGWQRRPLSILRTNARSQVDVLIHMSEAQDSPAWRAGWLAGLYDTDGGLADKSLAFYQKDREVLHRVARYAADFGFNVTVHQKTATLVGDLAERYAFCQLIRPALARKIPSLDARTLNMHGDCRVVAIEEVGERELVDITTSTGTFIAEGIVSHNCYATTKAAFWTGWPESGQGDLATFDPDTVDKLERSFASHGYRLHDGQDLDLPLASRRFRWINMQEIKFVDGGWRNERDYARLKLMIDAYVRANEAGIYSLTPSGSTCLYCPFRETCGGCGLPHENAGAP